MTAYELGIGQEISIQTSNAKLGEGFNSLSLSRLPQSSLFSDESIAALKVSIDMSEESLLKAQSREMKLEYVVSETSDQLATSLGIHAQAAASFFGVKAEGAASYVADKSFTENCLVASIRGWAQTRLESLKANPKLNEKALEWLKQPKALVQTYGDYYCSELIYGGELIIFIKITTNSVSEKQDIAAKLKATWSSGSASAEMESHFEEVTKNTKKEFSVYQNGSLSTSDDDKLSTLIDFAHHYFDKEELQSNLCKAVYRPLTRVPFGEPGFMVDLENILRPAWKKRDKLLLWLGEYQRAIHDYAVAASLGTHYLPTKYYDMVRQDMADHLGKLSDEIKDNAGRIEVHDPEEIVTDNPPEYYKDKLEERKIKRSGHWGGNGGNEFADTVKDLERLSNIETVTCTKNGWVFSHFRAMALLKDGRQQDSGLRGKTKIFGWSQSIPLEEGEYIEAVEARFDNQYIRQMTFWVRTKDKELQQYGPYPGDANPDQQWPGFKTKKLENIVVCGFHGRCGDWIDALGVLYIEK